MYPFKLPQSGKELTWRPLTVGQQLDIANANRLDAQKMYLQPSLLAAKIVSYDGRQSCSLAEIKSWSEIDYNALQEEIENKESAERLAFKKKLPGDTAYSALLDAKLAEFRTALMVVDKTMTEALDIVRASEATASPLAQTS